MKECVKRLVSLYGSEPWLAAISLGNENERFLSVGDEEKYYQRMDELAGVAKETLRAMGVERPIFLGHGIRLRLLGISEGSEKLRWTGPQSLCRSAGPPWRIVQVDQMNSARPETLAIMVAEFGQLASQLQTMTDANGTRL